VFLGLKVLLACTGCAFPREELPVEFACVCVAGVALDQVAKDLTTVFKFGEMFGGVMVINRNRQL